MVKPWQVVLATIGIFLAGLVTGGAITLRVVRMIHDKKEESLAVRGSGTNPNRSGALNPEQLGPQLIRRFATSEELNLGPGQKFKINQIARATSEKLLRLRRETGLSSLLLIEEMQDQISAILNSQQKAKFEALLSDQRQKMQEFKQNQQNELRKQNSDAGSQPQAPAQAQGK